MDSFGTAVFFLLGIDVRLCGFVVGRRFGDKTATVEVLLATFWPKNILHFEQQNIRILAFISLRCRSTDFKVEDQ